MYEINLGLIFLAVFAGVLTVFAPCVFTLLPAIVGGAVNSERQRSPLVISLSLGVSIFVFTLLLKFTSLAFTVPQTTWNLVAGAIILFFGVVTIIPELWDWLESRLGLLKLSHANLQSAGKRKGIWGDVLLGAALGPVFTSCSPTYFLILGQVLPVSFAVGSFYLLLYVLGLSVVLLLVAKGGQALVQKFNWAVSPQGIFKRAIGILLVLVGWSVMFGAHKDIQTFIVEELPFLNVSNVETQLINNLN